MLDHVLACMPEEACGILAGRERRVERVWSIENVAHSPVRFRMAPQGQIDALLTMEAQGLELLGIYHSHPSGPPGPSATDWAEAAYPEAATLIWCSDNGRWQVQAFDLSGAAPVKVEIEIL
jgi:proteasome lid subunit RPN8/RPN11